MNGSKHHSCNEFELDCESGKSAINSLTHGFSCSEKNLSEVLLSIDIEQIYENDWKNIDVPGDEYLYNYVVNKLGEHKSLTSVCWFHTTRTTEENYFKNGIQPLDQVLQTIWEILISKALNPEVSQKLEYIKSNGVDDYHYESKSIDSLHWGPYGILVQDVAFHSKNLAQHDYLAMPEIIEDICNGYEENFGECIIKHYTSVLIPKIVKFRSSVRVDIGCLVAAISYVYSFLRLEPPCANSVTCFDGEGVPISKDQILYVRKIKL